MSEQAAEFRVPAETGTGKGRTDRISGQRPNKVVIQLRWYVVIPFRRPLPPQKNTSTSLCPCNFERAVMALVLCGAVFRHRYALLLLPLGDKGTDKRVL